MLYIFQERLLWFIDHKEYIFQGVSYNLEREGEGQ